MCCHACLLPNRRRLMARPGCLCVGQATQGTARKLGKPRSLADFNPPLQMRLTPSHVRSGAERTGRTATGVAYPGWGCGSRSGWAGSSPSRNPFRNPARNPRSNRRCPSRCPEVEPWGSALGRGRGHARHPAPRPADFSRLGPHPGMRVGQCLGQWSGSCPTPVQSPVPFCSQGP